MDIDSIRGLKIGINDFRSSKLDLLLQNEPSETGYYDRGQSLFDASKKAIQNEDYNKAKVYDLLAIACHMTLDPTSTQEPFKPLIKTAARRTALPEDFTDDDIAFLTEIVNEISDPWLQARVADILWIEKIPRQLQYALLAIDAYRKIPMNALMWHGGRRACYERAIVLCRILRVGAGDRLREIEDALFTSLRSSEDGYFALEVSDLLYIQRLGINESNTVADILSSHAEKMDSTKEYYQSRALFESATRWYYQAKDEENSVKMQMCMAEAWAKQASERKDSERPSHADAAGLFEKAIQCYRAIPRKYRGQYGIDDRIAELHKLMNEEGELSLGEMGRISSGAIDITDHVNYSRKAVSGKDLISALVAFINVFRGFRKKWIRKETEELLSKSILRAMLAASRISPSGQKVAMRPGLGDPDSDDNEVAIWAEMISNVCMQIPLIVQGCIWPALEMMVQEHRLRERDFVEIAINSPVVPRGREVLFGKALFLGYDNDFVSALHLLIPQIENMVRYHLNARNIKTTRLDENGIEMENGLSTLMEISEVEIIFGEDLAFEIKAVFCDAFGPNLRNEVAHGLLDYEACQSVYAVYAWWLALKLVILPFWNSMRNKDDGSKSD